MSKMMFPACGWPVVLFLSRRHHSSLVWIVPCIYWNILTCCYHMKLLDGKNCFFFCCCYCCSWRRFWSCWLWNGSSTSMRGLSIHSVHFLWVLDLKINCWFTQTHVNGNPLQYSCLKNSMDRGDKTLMVRVYSWLTLSFTMKCDNPGEGVISSLNPCDLGRLLIFSKPPFNPCEMLTVYTSKGVM